MIYEPSDCRVDDSCLLLASPIVLLRARKLLEDLGDEKKRRVLSLFRKHVSFSHLSLLAQLPLPSSSRDTVSSLHHCPKPTLLVGPSFSLLFRSSLFVRSLAEVLLWRNVRLLGVSALWAACDREHKPRRAAFAPFAALLLLSFSFPHTMPQALHRKTSGLLNVFKGRRRKDSGPEGSSAGLGGITQVSYFRFQIEAVHQLVLTLRQPPRPENLTFSRSITNAHSPSTMAGIL